MNSGRLILIRHGQTNWSQEKKYCSFTDIGLNETGRRQARRLCRRLQDEKIHRVYSSDMQRVLEFAKIVCGRKRIKRLNLLREMDFGAFEGLTHQEIVDSYPQVYRKWLTNPLSITIPGGETLHNLAKRVRETVGEILSSNNNSVVAIFTHAGPIKVILGDILGSRLKEIGKIKQDLASLNIIEYVQGKGKIILFNQTIA